uniref:Uncharacterized protein n=1 Tax=Tetranychus urticae TaxID=32264 RepID=T1KMY4_TETUR
MKTYDDDDLMMVMVSTMMTLMAKVNEMMETNGYGSSCKFNFYKLYPVV